MGTSTETSNSFAQHIIDNAIDSKLIDEIEELIDLTKPTTNLEAGTLGTAYSKGVFLVDGDLREVYKRKYPLYYEYLHAWYHI